MILALACLSLAPGACDRATHDAAAPPSIARSGLEPATAPRTDRWNIVFFLSDALRAPNLSAYGYRRKLTPHLDALAAEGIVFEEHFSAAPFTRLSISQLFTGLFFAPPMMATQYTDDTARSIPGDVPLLPRVLREHGYRTALVSAHAWFSEGAPIFEWFDEHTTIGSSKASAPYEALMPAVRKTLQTAAADKRPFFLYLHSLDTHSPHRKKRGFSDHVGEDRALRRYDAYDSQISYTDHWVGEVLHELNHLGLSDHTLVVFTSDHGEEFGELGAGWSNKTHGSNVRRASTHVPLIMRLPPSHRVVGRFADATSHLDLTATLLALAVPGMDATRYHQDGSDLSRRILMREFGPSTRAIFSRVGRYTAMRRGDLPKIDVIFDSWSGVVDVFKHKVDTGNYPTPKRVHSSKKYSKAIAQLRAVVDAPEAHFRSFAEPPRVAHSETRKINSVVVAETDKTPAYGDADDGAWTIYPGRYVSCRATEDPGRLTLSLGNAAGNYRLALLVHRDGVKRGDRDGLRATLRIPHQRPKVFPPKRRERGERMELGIHELPDDATITLDQPNGGVMISGIALELQGAEPQSVAAPPAAPAKEVKQLERQLRALGYVE